MDRASNYLTLPYLTSKSVYENLRGEFLRSLAYKRALLYYEKILHRDSKKLLSKSIYCFDNWPTINQQLIDPLTELLQLSY